MDNEFSYTPIGFIQTPFQEAKGMPIQPAGARDVVGTIEIKPEYEAGLVDLAGFSHVILLYSLHLSEGYSLTVKPFLDDELHGVFSTRAPRRPNSIGLSVVRLVRVTGCTLEIEGVDMIDGTPLLDIKPFVPEFDVPPVERIGWLEKSKSRIRHTKADGRFL